MIEISALLLGMVSSWHCAGMCGPIALALPKSSSVAALLGSRILFNFGRIFTYVVMGALFGILGKGFILGGLQQTVAIISGAFILAMALFSFSPDSLLALMPWTAKMQKIVLKYASYFLRKPQWYNLLFMGILNGLLPCGMVYIALAGAVNTGALYSGIWFMLWFGLGTLPMMLGIAWLGNTLAYSFKSKIKKLSPFIMAFFAALLILRGLNLNIPFISPAVPAQLDAVVKCH